MIKFPDLPQIEDKILSFWKSNKIFLKSLKQNERNKRFNWFEGPPYANAMPHMGHFLTRIYKDTIMRFFTMLGYYVPRRAGWDTHGLPIEVNTEKELGFKTKKDIYDYGVAEFNKKCKELVIKYKDIWEMVDEKIGFWIDHKNAYYTFDPFYIESTWWILKEIYNKGLLKQEFRVAPYCPRCETVLAQAELGMPDAYRKVKDPSVYVKFKINDSRFKPSTTYLLAWTTTPWTLPGNLALAVNENFDYFLYKTEKGNIITHQKLNYEILKVYKGKDLIGLSYEPLFKIKNLENNKNNYKVYSAEFVKEEEGTGIVHIAPAYGEEDFQLGQKNKLSVLNYLDLQGRFGSDLFEDSELDQKIAGLFFKEADKILFEYLDKKGLIFEGNLNGYEHEYPHCWRCKTPLIYFATKFWLIKVSQIKEKIIESNEKVNWTSEAVKKRFYEWIKEGKDWNLSRTRFWGIPLPFWICERCGNIEVIGSLDELANHFKSNNNYILMRHTESLSNKKNFLSSYPEIKFNPLTRKGVLDAKRKARTLKKFKIDLIFASPLTRTKQTAEIISQEIKSPIIFDFRLREIDLGVLNGRPYEDFDKYLADEITGKRDFEKKIENGESLDDVRKRVVEFILEVEKLYKGKNILIISHGAPLWLLEGEMLGIDKESLREFKIKSYELGEIRKVKFKVLPRNEDGEIDLHRPYVDNFVWLCKKCKGLMKRAPEVADIWFDSGCVPFASYYYPRRNKKEIDQEIIYPADFIIEGIDQTRGWFYTLLVISTLIKNKAPYKSVISNGFVLDAQGKKMSKSLGNVVDPYEIVLKYGSDLPRFYMFYLNDTYENKRFNEKELIDLKREFFDLLLNILKFYLFYYNPEVRNYKNKKELTTMDLWFSARIKETYETYYNLMQKFEIHKASRLLFDLLSDFSRWWLRRSRERFQNFSNKKQLLNDLVIFQDFLYEFIKMLAPLAPFISEFIFQEIKDDLRFRYPVKESIHLEKLGKPIKLTLKEKLLLDEMEKIRKIASDVHRIRKEKKIKLRQPLKTLYLSSKYSPEVLEILKEEINVLEIKTEEPKQKENLYYSEEFEKLWLDLTIDEKLKELGIYKDFIRIIQDLRQDAGLTPKEIVGLNLTLPKFLEKIVNKYLKNITEKTKTKLVKKQKTIIAEKETDYENFGKIKLVLFKI